MFSCGQDSHNCEMCYGNSTHKPIITGTAAECQTACAADRTCAAFQWIGGHSELSLQCHFKCSGAVIPGRTQCTVGHHIGHPGGAYVCGPKHNDSSAPLLPPAPPVPPAPPMPDCPVRFGQSSGQLEAGTDHARADGLKGERHDLVCKPWCLFNLTSDIGERNDLGANPAYQAIAQRIAARLKYHGTTGPMPAYIWPPKSNQWAAKQDEFCRASAATGYVEPLDIQRRVTILDD